MKRPTRRGRSAGDPPLQINGWTLHIWSELDARYASLRREVERLRAADPGGYRHAPATKVLAMLSALMFREIPADPGAREYRQGHTLGDDFAHWQRAKFFRRFRLFFRYRTDRRAIVYVWLNDENTLRKAGAATDPYAVFAGMLGRGSPPDDFDSLLRTSRAMRTPGRGRPRPYLSFTFAHESRSVTVRLNTGRSGVESAGSLM